ncbi:MoaD/ThiS family protein [uncultured Winogradskyella sp.]|uniref:MoaD/ThiS family protein n=1 Tax=uncultured Winogradskyella sp. TaxID=395353 RepID=UPI00260DFDF7|nr:MoaD/ThiS family protein [uncultured Winogradskyella sp.]|tara:strand:- start:23923 stop:24159 length:237 start_codon:yes stop_codon:yes gene_type:complete
MAVIKYYGAIAEETKCSEEQMAVSDLKISDCMALLNKKYNLNAFEVSIALNQNLVEIDSTIKLNDSDELALLPPFAGG